MASFKSGVFFLLFLLPLILYNNRVFRESDDQVVFSHLLSRILASGLLKLQASQGHCSSTLVGYAYDLGMPKAMARDVSTATIIFRLSIRLRFIEATPLIPTRLSLEITSQEKVFFPSLVKSNLILLLHIRRVVDARGLEMFR